MGNWNITIRGVGPHHNVALKTDANQMAAAFVQALKDSGHSILAASITFGGEDDLTDTQAYLDTRNAYEQTELKRSDEQK